MTEFLNDGITVLVYPPEAGHVLILVQYPPGLGVVSGGRVVTHNNTNVITSLENKKKPSSHDL